MTCEVYTLGYTGRITLTSSAVETALYATVTTKAYPVTPMEQP